MEDIIITNVTVTPNPVIINNTVQIIVIVFTPEDLKNQNTVYSNEFYSEEV